MEAFLHNMEWVIVLRSDLLTMIFEGFTFLGYSSFLLIFLPVGFWILDKKMFMQIGLLLILSALLNAWLKDLFQDPRPDPIYQLDPMVGDSWGFPSGHAQIATVLWMFIAWEIRQKWSWILCSVIFAGICFSRLYLGVHDVEDILGGIALGFVTLILLYFLKTDRFKWLKTIPPVCQLLILIAVEVNIFITWPGKTPNVYYGFGTILVGFCVGVIIDQKGIHYQKHSKILRQVIAGFIGVLGLVVLRKGMSLAVNNFIPDNLTVNIVQAFIVGLYMTAIAPWFLIKVKLASQKVTGS
ncbi:MAG: phosphatase PAP2 family protein [Desulfobacterales bacterium]|nr:phosphatase PAP2 family protein [Desulfobacterales bacterium]